MLDTTMMVIDPHAHMTSRTTYDYLVMKEFGVVAVIEPAFLVRSTPHPRGDHSKIISIA